MIPNLQTVASSPWPLLPPGVHVATLDEVEVAFATNARRRELFEGIVVALDKLRIAGCPTAYIDGSYASGKPMPGDFDACWDPAGVDVNRLDPVFLDFDNGRSNQKAAFKGEFFPSSMTCADVGSSFVEFFQRDRFTGNRKGIISISLQTDPTLLRRARP
jgi:hypothetical protein